MKQPKILYIDIESSPNIVYSWSIGRKIFLSHDNIIKERQIICICWKWGHEKEVKVAHWGLYAQNDKSLLKTIVPILQEADIIVGHNSDKFDLRWINGRLLFHRLPPILNSTTEDTLKLTRKTTYLNCYKLDYLAQYLRLGGKIETTYQLWKDVLDKKLDALKKMVEYCKEDVRLTQRVYEEVSPYVDHVVNKSVIVDEQDGCPACGATITHATKNGRRYYKIGKKQRWICKKCMHCFLTNIYL